MSPCITFFLFSLVSMQSRRLLVGCRWTWHWSYLGPSWHNALAGGHCWGHLPLHHHVRSFCIPFLARSEFPIYILINRSKLVRRTGVNVDWYHVIPDFGLNRSPLWSRFNYFLNHTCEIFCSSQGRRRNEHVVFTTNSSPSESLMNHSVRYPPPSGLDTFYDNYHRTHNLLCRFRRCTWEFLIPALVLGWYPGHVHKYQAFSQARHNIVRSTNWTIFHNQDCQQYASEEVEQSSRFY